MTLVLTLIALIFSSPLLAQNPPSSIEELRILPNANRYWRAGLTQSPYAATMPNGTRLIFTFSEGEYGYPYMKSGAANPLCSRLGDDCMMGVVRIINFEWFTYRRTSDPSKFWLCIIYHNESEPWFPGCYDAQAGRSNTFPEVYNITMILGIRFVGQLPSDYIRN